MSRKGQLTASVFGALCLGGILTLFSQAQTDEAARYETRALDVAPPESDILRRVVPAAIEGASPPPEASGPEKPRSERTRKTRRMTLR